MAKVAIIVLNPPPPPQEFYKGFLGVSSGLPLVYSISRINLNISEGDMTEKKLIPKPLRGKKSLLIQQLLNFLGQKFACKILP
jgi:hypothetical protein